LENLKSKVISASKWSVLTDISSKAIGPLVFVVLARLLTPEDYGVVAAASIVIGFSQIFSDAGLSATLIQSRENAKKVANIVFWGNLSIALIVYLLICSFSDLIAKLFHDGRIADVLKVQSLILIFNGLSATHTALFRKRLDFQKLFWVRLFTVGAPGLASIPLAYFGFGYWALVAGTLFGAIFQVIILWKMSKWRPTFELDKKLVKKVFGFSGWVTLEGFLAWFFNWGDATIVGIYLSTKELGLFRTGNSFVVMIFGFLLSPLLPVLYSTFSTINNDNENLRSYFAKANKVIGFIVLPVSFSIFLFNHQIEEIVFGTKWVGVSEVFSIMALVYGLSWLVGANNDLYRAIGKPKINILIMGASLPFYATVYFLAVQKGLSTFLVARLALVLVMLPIHAVLSYKFVKYNYFILLNELKWIIMVIAMIIILDVIGIYFFPQFQKSVLFALILILITALTIFMFEKSYLINIIKMILNKQPNLNKIKQIGTVRSAI